MEEAEPTRPNPTRVRLSRRIILEAALGIVQTEGVHRLSVRRLTQALGVSPMAVYKHFDSKNAILAGVLDLLVREEAIFGDATSHSDWREWAHEAFFRMYSSLREHHELVALTIGLSELTPATREASEAALSVLRDAGFTSEEAVRLFSTLSRFVLGAVMLPMIRISPDDAAALSPEDSVRQGISTVIDGFSFGSLVEARTDRLVRRENA